MKREEFLQYFKTKQKKNKKKTLFYRRRGRIQFVQARAKCPNQSATSTAKGGRGTYVDLQILSYLLHSPSAGPPKPLFVGPLRCSALQDRRTFQHVRRNIPPLNNLSCRDIDVRQ
jgi:hypothetical protein